MKFWTDVFSGVFVTRAIVSLIFGGLTAFGISFFVADYVSNAAVQGFSSSVTNLQSGLDMATTTINGVNDDLKQESRHFRDQRNELSSQVNVLVAKLEDTNVALKDLSRSIVGLNATVQGIDKRLILSDARQKDFERFVYQVLISQAKPTSLKPDMIDQWGLGELGVTSAKMSGIKAIQESAKRLWQTYEANSK